MGFYRWWQRANGCGSDMAIAFVRAYTKIQAYIIDIPAAEIARIEKEYFPNIDEEVLEKCIKTYQALGCWMPHIEITEAGYQETLDIYQYNGLINERLYV